MTPTHETLRGTWRDRINTQEIPPHPIESSAAYKEYLVKRTESVRYSLEKILRYTQHCPLAELTATAIDHALMKLELEGYRPTTRDKLRRAIVAFLKWANARGFVWKNVALDATDVDLRRELVEPKIVPDEIRNALDEYYRNPQNASVEEMFMWASIKLGARISEIAMAMTDDIQLLPQLDGGVTPWIKLGTKTKIRKIDYPKWTVPALLALKKAAEANGSALPIMYLDGVPIVRRGNTAPTTQVQRTNKLREKFYEVQVKLFGSAVANPHSFRSDYITRALRKHPDYLTLECVAKRCGVSAERIREHYANLLSAGPDDLAEI